MRILCVSLLRLGDLVLQGPAIRAVRKAYPEAEIHLLTNRSNQPVAQQLRDVNKIHYFERDRIQESLGQVSRSVFEAEDRILDLAKRLERYNFDRIINFSHTRVSAQLTGLCKAASKTGLQIDSTGRFFIESQWYRFLNNFRGDESIHNFHYSDFFCLAEGAHPVHPQDAPDILLSDAIGPEVSDTIVINPWSSDIKKDWSDLSWIKLMVQLRNRNPSLQFSIVAGPDKSKRLADLLAAAKAKGLDVTGIKTDFAGLIGFLKHQKVLITVDSVVKHLAPYAGLKVIEIALGGSAPWKTGAYSQGALIIHPHIACAPCDNHRPCHKSSHLCSERLDAEDVAALAHEYLAANWVNLRVLADENHAEMKIYRTAFTRGGFWHLVPLWNGGELAEIDHLISLGAWKVVLEKSYLDPMFNFAAEMKNFESEDRLFARQQVQFLEGGYRRSEMALDTAISQFVQKMKLGSAAGYRESLERIENEMLLKQFLTQHLERFNSEGFSALRQIQESLNQLRQFQIAKLRLHKAVLAKESL